MSVIVWGVGGAGGVCVAVWVAGWLGVRVTVRGCVG